MKRLTTVLCALCVGVGMLTTLAAAANPSPPFTQCPAVGADASCALLIQITPNGQVGVFGDPTQGPFDGIDDTLIGVQNDSSSSIVSVPVSSQSGKPLFAFDGDGLCTFLTCTWPAPTGYEGPGVSFTNITADFTSATVAFSPAISPGTHTYFSLEDALATAPPFDIDPGPPATPTRYVALGDSVPYGHGLSNPYRSSRPGSTGVSQPPAAGAYPGLIGFDLQLTMNIRSSNCTLEQDDLAFSGAVITSLNASSSNEQCPDVFTRSVSVQDDELGAANLTLNPARLVTIQAGADDIHFSDCLIWELSKIAHRHWAPAHMQCVQDGEITDNMVEQLRNVRRELLNILKQVSQYAGTVAVLNYYQIIPRPSHFASSSVHPNGKTDPVCWSLRNNLRDAHTDAVTVQDALNSAIRTAVRRAHRRGIHNVVLVDLSNLEARHEMCTGSPAVFSGEPMSRWKFRRDLAGLATGRQWAEKDLQLYAWRAAHPNLFGQQDIAREVEATISP